jgi:hypothetical protein
MRPQKLSHYMRIQTKEVSVQMRKIFRSTAITGHGFGGAKQNPHFGPSVQYLSVTAHKQTHAHPYLRGKERDRSTL